MILRSTFLRALLALTVSALATSASAQSYGLNDQILSIGASEFQPLAAGTIFSHADPSFYLSGAGQYGAPVYLPNGAEITQMCLFAKDSDSSGSSAVLIVQKLLEAGQDPDTFLFIASSQVEESTSAGVVSVCSDPINYTVHSDADVGDGMRHLAPLVAFLTIEDTAAVGGLRITWHRQISDPPAVPTFGDVPTDGFGFQQIEALAASGITGGCGGGNFCPDAPLTRAQMAIFLAKALGLHWPN